MSAGAFLPFSSDVYASRMVRASRHAADAGLTGLVVTPGPDLYWLTGYRPTAITERLTAQVLCADREPTLLVPVLERPDAEAAPGADAVSILDWSDGSDPYGSVQRLLDGRGTFGISDSTWSMHLLALQQLRPDTAYRSLTSALPMLRAVKDTSELARLTTAGAAADATYEAIVQARFEGRRDTEVAADIASLLRERGHEQVDFTVVGSGENGANPHHEAGSRIIQRGDAIVLDVGGLLAGYGSDTTRTVRWGHPNPRSSTCTPSSVKRNKRPLTPSGQARRARTSTERRAR